MISSVLYGLGVLFFFDRAFLMLVSETFIFFARKIKGSLALGIGLIFIIIKWKFIGTICQLYGIFQFFKTYAVQFLSYFEWVPFIGPYITQMRRGSVKKNDDINKV